MLLREDGVRKVVSSRVCSVAIHPSESTVLVAAGDKNGHVGLWDVVSVLLCLSAPCCRTVRCSVAIPTDGLS